MSHYSNTWCVIPVCSTKGSPSVRRTDASFIPGEWGGGTEAFAVSFCHSAQLIQPWAPKQPACHSPLCIPALDQPRAELVTEVWGAQQVFQVFHCSMKRSFAKIMAGFHHCCKSNFEMFFSYILLYKMVPGWKFLCSSLVTSGWDIKLIWLFVFQWSFSGCYLSHRKLSFHRKSLWCCCLAVCRSQHSAVSGTVGSWHRTVNTGWGTRTTPGLKPAQHNWEIPCELWVPSPVHSDLTRLLGTVLQL